MNSFWISYCRVSSGVGPPMTYMLDGKQYIAVMGGTGATGFGGRGGGGRGAGAGRGAPPVEPTTAAARRLVLRLRPRLWSITIRDCWFTLFRINYENYYWNLRWAGCLVDVRTSRAAARQPRRISGWPVQRRSESGPAKPAGEVLFGSECATCHVAGEANRAPALETLRQMPADAVLTALTTGRMSAQAQRLSPQIASRSPSSSPARQ